MNTFDAGQVAEGLRTLAEAQQLRRQAEDGCRTFIKYCQEAGDLEGWSPNEIETRFRRCALVFEHRWLENPYIETVLDLYARDPGDTSCGHALQIGYYRLITLLDGTVVDDYFVLEKDKATVRE